MGYQNFEVAIYCCVFDINFMAEMNAAHLQSKITQMSNRIQFTKVYLETFRGGNWVDREKLLRIKEFCQRNNIRTSGGIATVLSGNTDFIASVSENSDFTSFCFSDPGQRETLRQVVQFTAALFDEIILDDFYFTNCRCNSCIAAKGEHTWSEFRMRQMQQVSDEIINIAKAINPAVQIIIKYPNWYDDYQSTGYNLVDEPRQFDLIYTGTETRNPHLTQQSLQRYTSYFLMRYLDNVKPGSNAGGWFDTLDCLYNLGSYAEQGYLTLFAKAREVTLFCAGLLERDGLCGAIAGQVFGATDEFLHQLGNPQGIACYKPYHSSGENYLHGYLGMLGIPLEPTPHFPTSSPLILLTRSAAHDPELLSKIKGQLQDGKNVLITSGLVDALQDLGLDELTGIRCFNRKVSLTKFAGPMFECSFLNYYDSPAPITLPVLEYSTNDCTQIILGFTENKGYPILLRVKYGKGSLLILTIPDDFGALYQFPQPIVDLLRALVMQNLPFTLEAPDQVGLFMYDNDTLIVESFLPYNTTTALVFNKPRVKLLDLITHQEIAGETIHGKATFPIHLSPTTYRVFKYQ